VEADTSNVLIPGMGSTCPGPDEKSNSTTVGENGALGVSAMTKVWLLPGARFTGAFGIPVARLVAGSVVWKVRVAAIGFLRDTPTPCAVTDPALTTVTNAVTRDSTE